MKKIYISVGIITALVLASVFALTPSEQKPNAVQEIVPKVATVASSTPIEKNENATTDTRIQTEYISDSQITTEGKIEKPSVTNYSFTAALHGTVLDAMYAYQKTSVFEFKTKENSRLGVMIEEINNLKNGDGYYWILSINNKKSEKGASMAQVSPGDVVEWKFEKRY